MKKKLFIPKTAFQRSTLCRLDADLCDLPSNRWISGALKWLMTSSEMCSNWAYVWISLDRYLATMNPNWYRVNGKNNKVTRPLFIATVISYILFSPAFFLFHEKVIIFHHISHLVEQYQPNFWKSPRTK